MNLKIEKFVTRQRKEGKEFFPDFRDVLSLYEKTNEEKGLFLSRDEILREAEGTFHAVCQQLKSRRVHDTEETFESYREVPVKEGPAFRTDPADEDEEMRRKLEQSKQEKERKEQEVRRLAH